MSIVKDYILVHVTSIGEYKAPLVASQLFDQAECQAVVKEGFSPKSVEAWIIGNMREYVDKAAQKKVQSLRERCPHITICMMNGISRLNSFPNVQLMRLRRRKLGKNIPVIYHCRGANAAEWVMNLKKYFPDDKIVIDIRGFWPAELLYARGIEDAAAATGKNLADYNEAYRFLKAMIGKADAITTVSNALKTLLIEEMGAPADTSVVPCCINEITPDDQRNATRTSWGLKENEIALVYSGTTAAYQHLPDLTIPFLKKLVEQNKNIRLVFLSPETDKIKTMLLNEGIDISNVILKSLAQNEVAPALNACDVGILIRKPTLVNRVANPVKIGEYLGAGLPIIITKNVGGVADAMFGQSLLKGIEITDKESMQNEAIEVNKWLLENIKDKRQLVKDYARKFYLWSSAIQVSRKMYSNLLKN